jgi:hypothetical protein
VTRDEELRLKKKQVYDRHRGIYKTGPITQAFRDHVDDLHQFIPYDLIAERAGVPGSDLFTYMSPTKGQHRAWRERIDAIMAVRLTAEERVLPDEKLRACKRILHGMTARGFSFAVVARYVPLKEGSLRALSSDAPNSQAFTSVSFETYRAFKAMADKLYGARPEDYGVQARGIRANVARGKKMRWAPLACWDLDEIHRAEAAPDWTGECGRPEGRRIHRRESIPICEACKATDIVLEPVFVFNVEEFRRICELRGATPRILEQKTGMVRDTFWRWLKGNRQPNWENLERVADALGVEAEELCRD